MNLLCVINTLSLYQYYLLYYSSQATEIIINITVFGLVLDLEKQRYRVFYDQNMTHETLFYLNKDHVSQFLWKNRSRFYAIDNCKKFKN